MTICVARISHSDFWRQKSSEFKSWLVLTLRVLSWCILSFLSRQKVPAAIDFGTRCAEVQKSALQILLLRARRGAPVNGPQNSAPLVAVAFISSRDLPSGLSATGDSLRRDFAFSASRQMAAKFAKVCGRLSRNATLGVRLLERRLAVVREVKERGMPCSNLAWDVANFHNYFWPRAGWAPRWTGR